MLELGFSNDDNRYDGSRPYPHPHLICVRCRKITDPQVSMVDDLTEEVAEQTGYEVISHRLDFYGVCPDCRKAQRQTELLPTHPESLWVHPLQREVRHDERR